MNFTVSGGNNTFEGPWSEAEDYDNTSLIYELFVRTIGR